MLQTQAANEFQPTRPRLHPELAPGRLTDVDRRTGVIGKRRHGQDDPFDGDHRAHELDDRLEGDASVVTQVNVLQTTFAHVIGVGAASTSWNVEKNSDALPGQLVFREQENLQLLGGR